MLIVQVMTLNIGVNHSLYVKILMSHIFRLVISDLIPLLMWSLHAIVAYFLTKSVLLCTKPVNRAAMFDLQ